MAKRFTSLLHKEWSGLHEAAILMVGFALLPQIFLLFRDRMLAYFFGASQTLDIYYAALRITDFLFVMMAGLLSALVLVPLLAKHAKESDARAEKFLDDIFTVFFALFVIISICVFGGIPIIIPILFRSFSTVAQAQLVVITRILLIAPILFGLSNFLASVTQMLNKFFAFVVAPLLYNLSIIVGAALLYPAFGIMGLAWGVAFGAFLSFFIYFFICARNGFFLLFSFRPSFLDSWEVIRIGASRVLSLATNQLALLGLIIFAAKMEPGSITIFIFSFDFQSVPLVVVGVSYVTAASLGLSKYFAGDDIRKFVDQIVTTSRYIIFWLIPTVILIIVLRAQLVRVILGSGLFAWTATRLTAAGLAVFALSIIAQSLSLLLVRGFHAAGDNLLPFIINVISAVVIILLGYGLTVGYAHSPVFQYFIEILLRVEGVAGTQVLMLPLAYTIGVFFNLALLVFFFKKRFGMSFAPSTRDTLASTTFASLLAGFVAYEFLVVFGLYLNLHTFKGIFLQGLIGGVAGILTWWLVLEIMGNEDIREIRSVLGSRIWKTSVILPGSDEL